ncbi:MAG: hypothetical protein JW857_08890 [Bacteroidales bacterium]|nr:hypothetical protein [Bacteroidales bacterium]
MRTIFLVILSLVFSSTLFGDSNDTSSTQDKLVKESVDVYYFHGNRRCETCKAVGDVSQELIASKYKEYPNVKFIEINTDEPESKVFLEKFKVSGSGLLVDNGKAPVNITVYAFQYALTNPDKLKNKLIQLINRNL